MTRVRADDYDSKLQSILASAADLFAKVGYPSAKLQDIAKACGASKSMLYHYFPTKDDLLSAMLDEHLRKLIQGIEEVIATPGTSKERFGAFVQVFIQKSAQSRRRNVSAMNDVKFLPKQMQVPIRALETKVADLIVRLLRELNPGLPDDTYKPYALLLIGMLNWTDTWYKPGGPIKSQELCERISRLFLKGFLTEKGA